MKILWHLNLFARQLLMIRLEQKVVTSIGQNRELGTSIYS